MRVKKPDGEIADLMTVNLRQAEAESRRLALVASKTVNAVGLSDAAGKVMWINEGFTRLFGYTIEECRGKFGPGVIRGPKTSPKVFKGSTVQIDAHGYGVLEKTLSLRQMSTRTHHSGRHTVEIVLNGHAHSIGHFDLHP